MEEFGYVIDLPRSGYATVRMERSPACEGCGYCRRATEESTEMLLEVRDPLGVAVGQRVLLTVPASSVLKASLIFYLLPLLVLLLVGALAARLAVGLVPDRHLPLVGILAGLGGMGVTFAVLRRHFRGRAEEELRPTIVDRS